MSKHTLLTIALIAFCVTGIFAQVQFRMDYDKTTKKYIVSLVPLESYKMPANLTGASQITVKAPTGLFFPTEVKGLYPGIEWDYNSRSNAPVEQPEHDYISFALRNSGLLHLPYQKGVAIPVLSFLNEFGCSAPVELINNETDPFMPPNSLKANVGQSIAVYGYGHNAFGGIFNGKGKADCQDLYTHTFSSDELISEFDLYPIPAEVEIFLEFEWGYPSESVRAEIVDVTGKTMSFKTIELITGRNIHPFSTSKLAAGTYFLKLNGESWSVTLDKFQKIRS